MSHSPVTGRLAPSPTGALHLGHALSFLAAWWSARQQNGRVILRLEDVDVDRAGHEHVQGAIEDLKWLGLDWDGDPIMQSTRTDVLQENAERLNAKKLAYPCVCTRGDLARAHANEPTGAPHGSSEHPYPGTCKSRFVDLDSAEAETGRDAGLRFIVRPGIVEFEDRVFGRVSCDVSKQVGDFLILRRNKTPAYQLAIVLDDAEDGVTEVVRGRDLLDSTCRQLLLIEALGLSAPSYIHLPLVCDDAGKRLAKRDGARSLQELRRAGISAHAVRTWAARCLGQTSHHSPDDVALSFDADRIPADDIRVSEDLRELLMP